MKKAGVKSRLVESDELSELTKQGVQRAMEARMTQLTVDEIDEVSGGVGMQPMRPVFRMPILFGIWPIDNLRVQNFGRFRF